MKITKLMQPKDSNQCGQVIIAMLGNISIQEAIKIMDTAGLTRTKHLIDALKILGLKVGSEKLLRIPRCWIKPKLCIVHIGFGDRWKKHWTLWNGYEGFFYDPAHESKLKEYFYNNGWTRMLTYLEIKEK